MKLGRGEAGCEVEIQVDYFLDETYKTLDNNNLQKNEYIKEVCRYFSCENIIIKNFDKCFIENCEYVVFNFNWELSVDEFVYHGDDCKLWDTSQGYKNRIIKTFKGLEKDKLIKKDNNLFELLNAEYNKNKYKMFEKIKEEGIFKHIP